MAQGTRQNLSAKALTGTSAGASAEWTFDRRFLVSRIKLLPSDFIIDTAALVRIRAEGEELYSGVPLPIGALFVKTDDGVANNATTFSPWVLAFDTPITVSKDFPLKVTISGTTESYYLITEGPSAEVAG